MTERERLMKVMESENMNAKQFAIEVGIQPGTISNIMSGRNNPSLDVMQRVLNRFRSINSDWLILGVGQMYRQNGEVPAGALFDIRPEEPLPMNEDSVLPIVSTSMQNTIKQEQHAATPTKTTSPTNPTPGREIQKIMIFYTDGTFEER